MRKSRIAVCGLAVLAFGGAFLVSIIQGSEAPAQGLPGVVAQSASSSVDGVVVRADRAVFSGTSVDVWLHASDDLPELDVAGARSGDMALGGVPASSVRVRKDGTWVARFPAAAWPPEGDSREAALIVRAVQAWQAGGLVNRPGTWALSIELPSAKAAREARSVEAYAPARVLVGGYEVPVEAFRTHSATVVRFALPASVWSTTVPTLRTSSGEVLRATSVEALDEHESQVWFDPVPAGSPFVIRFEGLFAEAPSSGGWSAHLALESFDPPAEPGNREGELLRAIQLDGPGAPEVREVRLRTGITDVRLAITIEGRWHPGPTAPIAVAGDGRTLRVIGVVNYDASSSEGERTVVSVVLPDGKLPPSLSLLSDGATVPLDPVEVTVVP